MYGYVTVKLSLLPETAFNINSMNDLFENINTDEIISFFRKKNNL